MRLFGYGSGHAVRVALVFLGAFVLSFGCGGGGGGGGTTDPGATSPAATTGATAADQVKQITDLEANLAAGTITDDEFLAQFETILAGIESSTGGLAAFQDYVEETVLGYSVSTSTSQTMGTDMALKDAAANQGILARIKESRVYIFLETVFTSAIFTKVPEPASTLIQVAQPEVFVAFSHAQVRTHIYDACFSNRVSFEKCEELKAIAATNPYEAERQLLTATGQTIPNWLQPAPTSCLHNCTQLGGTFTGNFSRTGQFSRQFPETTCTWNMTFTGSVKLTLTTGSGSTVSGSARVNGTESHSVVSGSVPARTCLAGSFSFDDTGSVSGNTASMTWSTDMGGGGGIFTGKFTGSLSGSTVSGNDVVSYSLGSGSLTIPLTLTK